MPTVSPLDDSALADICWHLEVYPQWRSGPDYDRAQRIEANLLAWGKAVCAQLAQSAEWKNLAAAIQHILAGE